jgi:DNA-binding LacI/PurR family transcriptional regulator
VPRARPVTLLDVARAAGVSRTTASAALGGSGRLSQETRAHVEAVARRLGYRANPAARHLRRGRLGAIGLHLPSQTTGLAYYMAFAFGVVEQAQREGLSVTLLAPDAVAPAQVDGFVVVDPLRGDPLVRALLSSGAPVVSGEQVAPGEPAPAAVVQTDHAGGLRTLLDHLAARGAARPALLAPDETSAWAAALRTTYEAWCAERRVAPSVRDVPFSATADDVRAVSAELLGGRAAAGGGAAGGGATGASATGGRAAGGGGATGASATGGRAAGGGGAAGGGATGGDAPRPDAIVCAPDGSALGAIAAAREVGLTVGQDLLVAACVDSAAMALATPPVTALDLHPRAFGRRCAATLLALLAGETPAPETLRQPADLVVRGST